MTPLRKDGVRLAIDDAGAGFASLRHVLRLSPDMLKIDGSVMYDEGAEPLSILGGLGIGYGQGYYLGAPAALIPF